MLDEVQSWDVLPKGPTWCSPVVEGHAGQALVWWHARGPMSCAVRVRAKGHWSNWLSMGQWGSVKLTPGLASCGAAAVDVDMLSMLSPIEAMQWRVTLEEGGAVDRLGVVISRPGVSSEQAFSWQGVHEVPVLTQTGLPGDLATRACSPTCLAMLLASRGIRVPVEDVAAVAYDAQHEIYGNWTRAVATLYHFGLPAQLARFRQWSSVARHLAQHGPLAASIAFEQGGLPGAPLPRTPGHLVVVRGLDPNGNPIVNDPASPGNQPLTYPAEAFGRAWFGHGGVAYILH